MAVSTIPKGYLVDTVYKATDSIAANSGGSVSIPITIPTGYQVGAVTLYENNGYNLVSFYIQDITNSAVAVKIWNGRSSAQSFTVRLRVLYVA